MACRGGAKRKNWDLKGRGGTVGGLWEVSSQWGGTAEQGRMQEQDPVWGWGRREAKERRGKESLT